MIADEVSIYNLALNAVGARNNISLTTENSREAEVCRLWYPVIRDQVLASAFWPSATAFKRLALLVERNSEENWVNTDPAPGFAYIHSTPADMLRPRYFATFAPFALNSYPGDVVAISSNEQTPILTYTSRQTNIALWDSELQLAIVYGLAANVCMPLTGKPGRARTMLEQANTLIAAAREGSANTNSQQLEVIPDWIAARGYNGGFTQTKFLYPFGSDLSVMTANVN